jgi:hypothetical protein
MRLFTCCCGWSYVIGRKRVYGAIWAFGIGEFPQLLSNSQRMMTRAEFKDWYADCHACWKGRHRHVRPAGKIVEAVQGVGSPPGTGSLVKTRFRRSEGGSVA